MDKPIAWYDPSNGMVSTDQDCPLFTPLGQVWGLYPQRTWVGLTDEEITELHHKIKVQLMGTYKTEDIYRAIEAKLKEKNK
jgi:hypothetical protein